MIACCRAYPLILILLLAAAKCGGDVKIDPAPPGEELSKAFAVKVEGKDCPVYLAKVAPRDPERRWKAMDDKKNSADFWMSEVSGIPFGLMGEMLEGGGNPWRGMVFGMTNRMPWSAQADPRPLWKLWDEFGIKGSTMQGWWAPSVPVTTGRDDVKATVYRRSGRAMVAIASWAPEPVRVVLRVDWKALGLDAARARFVVPAVQGLQDARSLNPGDAMELAPGKGIILIIR